MFFLKVNEYRVCADGDTTGGLHILELGECAVLRRHCKKMPRLAPSMQLVQEFEEFAISSSEFARRYQRQLSTCLADLEVLWQGASSTGLMILHGGKPWESVAAQSVADSITEMECERRWEAGWIVGGYTYPLRDLIIRLGGLHFARHKVWVMPNRSSWRAVQVQMPGDF